MKELKIEETSKGVYGIIIPEGCQAVLISTNGSKPIAIQVEGIPESEYKPSDEDVKRLFTKEDEGGKMSVFHESEQRILPFWDGGLHKGDEMDITSHSSLSAATNIISRIAQAVVEIEATIALMHIIIDMVNDIVITDEPAKISCLTLGNIKPSDTFGITPKAVLQIDKKETVSTIYDVIAKGSGGKAAPFSPAWAYVFGSPEYIDRIYKKLTMSKAKEWMKANGLPDKDTVTLSVKNADRMIEECSEFSGSNNDVICITDRISLPVTSLTRINIDKLDDTAVTFFVSTSMGNLKFGHRTTLSPMRVADNILGNLPKSLFIMNINKNGDGAEIIKDA